MAHTAPPQIGVLKDKAEGWGERLQAKRVCRLVGKKSSQRSTENVWRHFIGGICFFAAVNAACSRLDLTGCLARFLSRVSFSPPRRLLGFAVTFDREYKVSPPLPQMQSAGGWNECDGLEFWEDQIAAVKASPAPFHQPF